MTIIDPDSKCLCTDLGRFCKNSDRDIRFTASNKTTICTIPLNKIYSYTLKVLALSKQHVC